MAGTKLPVVTPGYKQRRTLYDAAIDIARHHFDGASAPELRDRHLPRLPLVEAGIGQRRADCVGVGMAMADHQHGMLGITRHRLLSKSWSTL